MAVVYDRKIDDKVTTFGTTGYTLNSVFVLYDRLTNSVWYPLKDGAFDAVSGTKKGDKIAFISKPEKIKLGDWVKAHPDTVVMLEPPLPERLRQRREAQRQGRRGRRGERGRVTPTPTPPPVRKK